MKESVFILHNKRWMQFVSVYSQLNQVPHIFLGGDTSTINPNHFPTIWKPFSSHAFQQWSSVACLAKSPWKSGASERVNHTQCHWIRNRYAVSWDEQNLGMVSIGRMVEVYCPFSWKVVREWNVESWLICFLILPFRFFCVEKSSLLLLLNLRCHLDSRSSLIKGWIKINDQHFECLRTVWFAARTFVKVGLLAKSVHPIPSKQTS